MAPKARSQMIEETRNKLLEAARQAFGSVGYAQTSMDELTASAGLTRGALYHHFGDKKGLLQAVVQQVDAELDVQLAQVSEQAANAWEGFKGRCRVFLEMATHIEVQRIMLRDAPSVLGSEYLQSSQSACSASLAAMLRDLMDTHVIQHTDPEALARLIQGGLMDASFWIAADQQPPQRLTSALDSLDLMLRGVLRAPQP
ncbi:TetR/AcrR family transcriptional regulator [Pseudomonas lundensis]|uniref:TetR/AcrR family transcriptional regulator n=1 Tax=Pseudomonas lundensis TaxID=86185 RepID=UPI0014763AC8|nr:TetR/AcrR family transcriptional regulator [Pseudomonas lundensis]NMZ98207.1 TetR/AcrR family transcriptional regulator [Pseudomonas lundensis]